MECVKLLHHKCDNVLHLDEAAKMMKNSDDHKRMEHSFTRMKTQLENLLETRVKNLMNCEKSISDINGEITELFNNFTKHLELLRDQTLQEVSAAKKDILPHLQFERDELKCKITAIEKDIKLLNSKDELVPPVQYLQAMEKWSEQIKILDRFINDNEKSLENISICYEPCDKISEITKYFVSFGTVLVDRRLVSTKHSSAKEKTDFNWSSSTLAKEVNTSVAITGAAFTEDGQILISKNGANLLELWDDNCKQLSTLALPGYPMGIKMTSDTVGAVVILDTALEFFEVGNNTISELRRVDVPVKRDFLYHKGKFYIGGDKKIIVQDSNNKHLRDVPVDNTVGYMCIAAHDNTMCFTELGGSVLYCITLDGKSKFQYSHEKLRSTHGVTVDCSGNIYVCGYSSGNVHQLNREGELQKIMFDNLHSNPHCISINKDNDKAVIGCHLRVSLYKMM